MQNNSPSTIKPLLFRTFIYVLIAICVFLCETQSSFAKNNVYFYEPMEVELDGTIAKKKIDCNCNVEKDDYEGGTGGVVGYDNDDPDNHFRVMRNECVFLLLDEPIDVKKPDHHFKTLANSKKNSTPENNVEVLQMTNDDNIDPDFSIGDRVHVTGSLYRHFQKCDHSRVLIDVVDLKVIESMKHKYPFREFKYFLKSIILKFGFYLKTSKIYLYNLHTYTHHKNT